MCAAFARCDELIPEWLNFVDVVVDSEDVHLRASHVKLCISTKFRAW